MAKRGNLSNLAGSWLPRPSTTHRCHAARRQSAPSSGRVQQCRHAGDTACACDSFLHALRCTAMTLTAAGHDDDGGGGGDGSGGGGSSYYARVRCPPAVGAASSAAYCRS